MKEGEWLSSEDPAAMLHLYVSDEMPWPAGSPAPVVSDRKLRLFTCACAMGCYGAEHALSMGPGKGGYGVWDATGEADPNDPEDTKQSPLRTARSWVRPQSNRSGVEDNVTQAEKAALLREVVGNPFRPVPLDSKPCPNRQRMGCPGKVRYFDTPHLDRGQWECDRCTYLSGDLDDHGAFTKAWRSGLAFRRHWRTPAVLSLANAAYDDRGPRRCPTCRGSRQLYHVATPTPQIARYRPDDEPARPGPQPVRRTCHVCGGKGKIDDGSLDPLRLLVLADALEESGCTNYAILSHLRSPGPHVRGCWALDLILNRE